MLPFNLPSDLQERAKLQRRRDIEAERKQRIFNHELRTIGLDLEGLDKQVKQKKEQEEAEKKKEDELVANILHNSKAALILQQRDAREWKEETKAMDDFRRQHQQFCQRSEFDLNDPNSLKKTKPCDAQMMLPGLLGEDVGAESRKQRQKEQMRDWIQEQQQEHMAARDQQMMEDYDYDQCQAEMENMADQLLSLEMEERKATIVATKCFNLAQIEEKQLKEEVSKHESDEMGEGELFNSTDRVPPSDSLQQVVQIQKQQMEDMKRRKEKQEEREQQLDKVRLDSAHTALLMEREQIRMNKDMRHHVDTTNAQLAKIAKEQKHKYKRGGFDDSFFSQFNTCSR